MKSLVKLANDIAPIVRGDNTFTFVFSDGLTDRQGDRVNPDGWILDDFEKNPVVQWCHDWESPPIGRASNVRVEDGRLLGDITFADTPFAQEVRSLVEGGFLRGVSVGFQPLEYEYSDDPERNKDIERQALLEVSLAPIPANPRCLLEAKEKGLSTPAITAWVKTKAADKRLPADERAIFKSLLNTQASDSDHKKEFSIEEVTLMASAQILKLARAEIKRANAEINRLRARLKAEDDMDDEEKDESEDPDIHLKTAAAHFKAADELHDAAYEHHEEGMKCITRCIKAIGGADGEDNEPDGEDEKSEDEDDAEIEKILARAGAKWLSRK
jgi:HK97 family phage prohead protease